MKQTEFIGRAKEIVTQYAKDHLSKGKPEPEFETVVVWYGYILGHMKALLTTDLPDGMYYEVTYNGDKDELYVDCYKKWENFCVQMR